MSFPNYAPDVFDALVSAVESDMGTLLPDKCVGEVLRFHDQETDSSFTTTSCRCKQKSKMTTVYDPSEPTEFDTKPISKEAYQGMIERGSGYTTVCANCDSVGHWPKYNYVQED